MSIIDDENLVSKLMKIDPLLGGEKSTQICSKIVMPWGGLK
jgi:hypothetical protein